MRIDQQFCFKDSSGDDIFLFTMRNANGTEVCITNYGAIITSFKIKNKEKRTIDMVLGFDDVADYFTDAYLENYPWFGCIVGRYANRIKEAEFKIDEKLYHISKNKEGNHLHGGFNGFDKKTWKLKASGLSPCPFLEMSYLSPDGEEGFPGNLDTVIRFELNNENELSYECKATCDQPTAVNLTHHSYFNLNGGKGTINDHLVKIYSSKFLDQDDNLVATGIINEVAGTQHDFRDFAKLSERVKHAEGYDQSFVTDENYTSRLELVAEVKSQATNTHLQVYSTEPVVHFYSGKWVPSIKGKGGIQYGPFSGLCLETQKHPNAVNISHFPNTILRPGETYFQRTVYKLIIY